MPEAVRIGAGRFDRSIPESAIDPDQAPPAPPAFPEAMEAVRAHATKLVGKVRFVQSLQDAVPAVRQYLEADDVRRRKMAESKYYWDKPKFESPEEQRRLRIVNSLFVASMRLGFPGSAMGSEARDLSIRVGEQHVGFKLEALPPAQVRRSGPGRPTKLTGRLKLSINRREYPGGSLKEWSDASGAPLEGQLSEVLVEILVAGEQFHRESAEFRYRWILEQRDRKLHERQRIVEERERERVARLTEAKRARVRRLLGDARAWRRAIGIRAYASAVEAAYGGGRQSELEPDVVATWVAWARSEADEIDPTITRRAVFDPTVAE
jgi:hypothetical protein